MAQPNAVTPFEVAVLVLHYLDASGHKKTAGSFKREARLILGNAVTALPAGVKSLQELLNDYVGMRERDGRRQQLLRGNPVAQSLYSLLDFHAGLPTPQHLPPVFYAAAAPPGGVATDPQAQQQQQQQQQHGPAQHHPQACLPSMLVPIQGADLTYHQPVPGQSHQPVEPQQQQQEQQGLREHQGLSQPQDQQGGQHTPGRQAGHRKAAPRKRRKLEGSLERCVAGWGSPEAQQQHVLPIVGDAAGTAAAVDRELHAGDQILAAAAAALGGGGMRGGALDLLNMPLDEEGLISLLCDDDLQNRFASGLAQHITTVINHQPPAHNTAGTNGTAQGSEDHLCLASIEDVLAELPADPEMAQLLQQFVRAEAGPAPPAATVGVGGAQGACTRADPGVAGRSGSAGRLPASSPTSGGGSPPAPLLTRAEGPLDQRGSLPERHERERQQQQAQQPIQRSGQAQHSGQAGQQAQQVARQTAAGGREDPHCQPAAPSEGCMPAAEPAAVSAAQHGRAEPSLHLTSSQQGQELDSNGNRPAGVSSQLDRGGEPAGGLRSACGNRDPGPQLSGRGLGRQGGPQSGGPTSSQAVLDVGQPAAAAAEQRPAGMTAPAEPQLADRQQQDQRQEEQQSQPQTAGDRAPAKRQKQQKLPTTSRSSFRATLSSSSQALARVVPPESRCCQCRREEQPQPTTCCQRALPCRGGSDSYLRVVSKERALSNSLSCERQNRSGSSSKA